MTDVLISKSKGGEECEGSVNNLQGNMKALDNGESVGREQTLCNEETFHLDPWNTHGQPKVDIK